MSAQRIPRLIRRGLVLLATPLQAPTYDYLVRRALVASSAGNHEEAKKWARRAIRIRSTPPEAWLALSRAAVALRDWNDGLVAAREILLRDGSHSEARILRFVCLVNSDRASETVSDWRRLSEAEIRSIDPETRVLAVRDFLQAGLASEAAAVARTVRHQGAAVLEVEALLRAEQFEGLVEVLTEFERDLPEDLRAWAWSRVNIERGRPHRAGWWLDTLPNEPAYLASWIELAESFVDQNLSAAAHRALDRAASLLKSCQPREQDFEFVVAGARLSLASHAPATAKSFGKTLVEEFADHPWSWLWLARALRADGLLAEALSAVEESLARQDDLLQAWEELTLILEATKDDGEKAVATNRRMVELSDGLHYKKLSALGNLAELGDHDYVRRHLCDLVSDYPDNRFVMVGQYEMLNALGDIDDAAEVLSQIESRTDPTGRAAAFRLSLDRERYQEAAERLLELPADVARPVEVSNLASALRHLGEFTRALEVMHHAQPTEHSPGLERLRDATRGDLEALAGRSEPLHRRGAVSPVRGRVLHLVGKSVPHFSSGYTIRTKYLVEAQKQAGIDAWVLTEPGFPWSVGVEAAPLEETVEGVTYLRCLPPEVNDDTRIDRMADIVRRLRPAVLHAASDFRNAVNALTLGRAFGIPVVYEVRGIWEETWVSKRNDSARESEHFRLRRKRETECMLAADQVVTLSETLKAELMSRGIENDKITVVPNAVDADRFPVQRRDPALASRWGILSDEVTVGYISSLVAYEGIQYLIEAVVDLRKQGRPVRAVIVGDGEEREALEQYTQELGAGGAVIFTGRVPHDEILAYYGLIDVFVIPRTAARVCQLVTPLKPYEAMATGRALVLSAVDALREIGEDGVTELVFEPENSSDLARQIDRLILDSSLRAKLGANAARAVRQTHTWPSNAQRYRSLYKEMGVL